jgi:hypothetical protein
MAVNKHKVGELHAQYPDMSHADMAERLGCRTEYVRATLSRARAAARNPSRVLKPPGVRSTWSKAEAALMLHKREIEGKSWRVIGIEMGRPLSSCSCKYNQMKLEKVHPPSIERPRDIPPSVIDDALRRCLAPRSITALLFGDPAPGQSALDKRQGAFA